jgi:hypothetical protein
MILGYSANKGLQSSNPIQETLNHRCFKSA